MTESKRADTYAKWQIQGKVKDQHDLRTSANGNSYMRVKLEAGVGPQKFTRSFLGVAFGQTAEDIANGSAQGDIIQLSGEIQPQKNDKTGYWENSFIVRSFKLIEQALQNNPELVDSAIGAADDDEIPF